jgi:hypothetical protein
MASNAPARGGAGNNVIGVILGNPAVQETIVKALIGLLLGFIERLMHPPAPAPVVPPTQPIPAQVQPDPAFPDDHHPAPPQKREVGRVRLKLARGQYQRERFPEKYTEDNPQGLIEQDYLQKIQAGESALPWGSKFWLDLTPYDTVGRQITRPEMIAMGLAFFTEHRCGGAFIAGNGVLPGSPLEPNPWQARDTEEISNGISAWKSSLGYLHQMRAWKEGSFEVQGRVADIWSEAFTLKVS